MFQPRRSRTGETWAYRAGTTIGDPVLKVDGLQQDPATSKRKVRVRYLNGAFAGLDEWVPKVRLHVPWERAEPWHRDEHCLAESRTVDQDILDDTIYWAVSYMFLAFGDQPPFGGGYGTRAYGVLEIIDLQAARALLKIDPEDILSKPHSFVDRFNDYRASFAVGLELAQGLCSLYPEIVLDYVGRELDHEGREAAIGTVERGHFTGPEIHTDVFRVEDARYTLVRSWCGSAATEAFDRVMLLETELKRLRAMVEVQISWFGLISHPHFARELRQTLESREEGTRSSGS